MPAKPGPSSIVVRMYRVGFGDCFLLTFPYPAAAKIPERHMLIDFGSSAAPRYGPKDYLQRVAQDIVNLKVSFTCWPLPIAIATTSNGFATNGSGGGRIIAALPPDHLILPWTEDPNAAPDATAASASGSSSHPARMKSRFLGTLENLHRVAADPARRREPRNCQPDTRAQLQFLGEENLKNRSAIENLMRMGQSGKAWYVNAGITLNNLLTGVKITVLGPPTLNRAARFARNALATLRSSGSFATSGRLGIWR